MAMPKQWRGSDLRSRSEVIQYLAANGGEVSDKQGLVVTKLRDALGKGRAISQLLADMEADKMIAREIRGRRTYTITTLDDWGLAAKADTRPALRAVAPPATDGELDLAGTDIDLLAESLLAIVIKRASQPVASAADTQAQREMAKRLRAAETSLDRATKQLRSANEGKREAEERTAELATQVEALENNLALMQKELTRKPSKRSGPALSEHLDADGKALLATLMRQLPETPQSKPRETAKRKR